jgi:DNA recombination protein RmuC
MNASPVDIGIALLVIFFAGTFILLLFLLRRPVGNADLSATLQNLTQAIQSEKAQTAVLSEKLSRLEPAAQHLSAVQIELKGLGERIGEVERNQTLAGQNLHALQARLSENGAKTGSLSETTAAIRAELSHALQSLSALQSQAKARMETERQTAESIRRLEAILAGTQSKGAAGENILDVVFAKLPPDWQVRDFKVGNKTVEFGLRLPNNLILPIDSKWPATSLLERFAQCEDPGERIRIKERIVAASIAKAREVKKYIDPALTVNFGIAAVPDAVYDLCGGAQAEAFLLNVVMVSYSMFVPYLLLVFQTVLKTSQNIDLEKLDAQLRSARESVETLQEELEGRFSRALTMLGNSRNDMSLHLSKINSGLTSLRIAENGGSPEHGTALPPPLESETLIRPLSEG